MTITRWNPIREMNEMRNLMDRVFYDTWRPVFQAAQDDANSLALDVTETPNSYEVRANLPGVAADAIHVKVENDWLFIGAEIPASTVQQEGSRVLMLERPTGQFARRIHLPQHVDFDHAEAHFENGVLTLTLPKRPEAQPRTLTVRTGNGNGNGNGKK